MSTPHPPAVPRPGMLAVVRHRRGLVASVDPSVTTPDGVLHLTRVEYLDHDGAPDDTLVWELEGGDLQQPTALPRVDTTPAMPPRHHDALLRATRFSALTPFLALDGSRQQSRLPIASPFFGAVQTDDFQLVPLLKALSMPRISLLIADDVGLGKTVEAGLVLTELLVRRRIRRVLVLTPASLRLQWQRELHDKFSLAFDVVDRPETHALRRRQGLDANPWRSFQRIVASTHYLRQPDVLEQLLATCRSDGRTTEARLPWDLLIVDEAHNLSPSPFGRDSELCQMLRHISPYFEHKLFLTATPHNGHTRSFTGLLELLDPVRFTQTTEMQAADRDRAAQVVVRRLKSEINALDEQAGRTPRFPRRTLAPLPLFFGARERRLAGAVATLRTRLRSLLAATPVEERASTFAIEVLTKRLLSSPTTFAESWARLKRGTEEAASVTASEVEAARRTSEQDVDDDREREDRTGHAVWTIGAWLAPVAAQLAPELHAVDDALAALGLPGGDPPEDARFERLVGLVDERLRRDGAWHDEDRLVVFTEYKTTLDALARRLRARYRLRDDRVVRELYGGMAMPGREAIKRAFNDPADPVRILLATDAASEGLNLQETARLLLHYDVPWNPARLEQRNGRLDRHGQARDVTVYHFTSEDDADLRFLAHVVGKVETIRDDLGSMGEVFDTAFQRRFARLEDAGQVARSLDQMVGARNRLDVPREAPAQAGHELAALDALCRAIDLSPHTLRDTLEVGLGIGAGFPQITGPDQRTLFDLCTPIPAGWRDVVDDSLRLDAEGTRTGPLPRLAFDPLTFVQRAGRRPVFRPLPGAVLLHLGHPMLRHALALFARARFPGAGVSRWTVRRGGVPAGARALVLLSVEELAVNALRETFHHWVRTWEIPVTAGGLGEPRPLVDVALPGGDATSEDEREAQALWLTIDTDVRDLVAGLARDLRDATTAVLAQAGRAALDEERARFAHRKAEVRRAMATTTLDKLRAEVARLRDAPTLFAELEAQRLEKIGALEEELSLRTNHYEDLLGLLDREQERVVKGILPRRHELATAQVLPVTVEIRLPEATP